MGHSHSGSMVTLDYTHTSFSRLLDAVDQLPNLVNSNYHITGRQVRATIGTGPLDQELSRIINEVRVSSGLEPVANRDERAATVVVAGQTP